MEKVESNVHIALVLIMHSRVKVDIVRSVPRFNNGGGQQGGYNRQQGGGYRPRTADYNPNAKYSMKKQIEYKDVLIDPDEPIRLNKFLANAGICSAVRLMNLLLPELFR